MLTNEALTRQLDLIPLDILDTQITIVGAGAIGSFTALSLAKMGFSRITVFDTDTISIENMNCQFYPLQSVGDPKVGTLQELIGIFTGLTIDARDERVEDKTELSGNILISAVDNMATRSLLFEKAKSSGYAWLIDPRMGGEYALMYSIDMNDKADTEMYAKTLYTDDESVQERCTARSTMYTVGLLSGMVCKTVKDVLTGKPRPRSVDWNIAENSLTLWKKCDTRGTSPLFSDPSSGVTAAAVPAAGGEGET